MITNPVTSAGLGRVPVDDAFRVPTRPQIQEEAINQLAELLQEKMQPDGLAIVMEADHYCMQWRGVKDMDSKMTNSIMRGSFLRDSNLRREFLALLTNKRG